MVTVTNGTPDTAPADQSRIAFAHPLSPSAVLVSYASQTLHTPILL